jgi:hypothetical protein
MDKEDRDHYEALLEMFTTPGWDIYINIQQDAYDRLEKLARVDCPTNEAWQFRRGELDKLWKTINFDTLIKNDYDSLEQEDAMVVESDDSKEYDPLH